MVWPDNNNIITTGEEIKTIVLLRKIFKTNIIEESIKITV